MVSFMERTRITKEQLDEIKRFYEKEAFSHWNKSRRTTSLKFLPKFDYYYDLQEGKITKRDKHFETGMMNVIEMRIKAYFKAKERGEA